MVPSVMSSFMILLAQISVILLIARLVGWGFRKIHQPQVMGEIVAGLLLGPSVLGWLVPAASTTLFPPDRLEALNSLGQIGAVLFIFLVGLRIDLAMVFAQRRAVAVISHASIVCPLVLGAVLALYLYPKLSVPTVPVIGFALFIGAAMSVTALPVLAHILEETKLSTTSLGTLALACAAVKDVAVWCMLAGIVAVTTHSEGSVSLGLTLAGSAVFVLIMIKVVREGFRIMEARYRREDRLSQEMLAVLLLTMAVSAWVTEWLGIHALFGAFIAGAIMPKDAGFVSEVSARLDNVTMVLLLPLYFACTGLRTSLGLIHGAQMWLYFGLIMLVAVIATSGGTTLAARLVGISWTDGVTLGVLMNTRGIMEIVILNIGHDIGVISSTMFAMMLLMALVTTGMTMPLLRLCRPYQLRQQLISA
jgi:Kef-type K+ transport system membrane component KefB